MCSRHEQRSVSQFLVAEKHKPCEICRRMWFVWRTFSFLYPPPQNVYKSAKHQFITRSMCKKKKITVYGVETDWLSIKEKVPGAVFSKGSQADGFLGHERTHHQWFPWKKCNCKHCFLLLTPLAKFTLFIDWPIYIYFKIYIFSSLDQQYILKIDIKSLNLWNE